MRMIPQEHQGLPQELEHDHDQGGFDLRRIRRQAAVQLTHAPLAKEGHRQADQAGVGVAAQIGHGVLADPGHGGGVEIGTGRLHGEHAQHEQRDQIDPVRQPGRPAGGGSRHGGIHQAAGQKGKAQAQQAGEHQRAAGGEQEAAIRPEISEQNGGLTQAFPGESGLGQIQVGPAPGIVSRHGGIVPNPAGGRQRAMPGSQ